MDDDWQSDSYFLRQLFDEEMEDLSDYWHPSVTVPDSELLKIVEEIEARAMNKEDSVSWGDVSMDDHDL